MMDQMRIHTEILEATLAGTSALDEGELIQLKPGIVTYRCKVFRALLEIATESQHSGPPFVVRTRKRLG